MECHLGTHFCADGRQSGDCKESALIYQGKSCLINQIPLFDKMDGFESEERVVDVIYFNSSKAFHTVFHKIHVPKL